MKRLKFLLPLIAIIFIAAGVFAMKANKNASKQHPDAVGYYQYMGDPSSATQRVLESNYTYVGSSPAPTDPCADGSEVLCGVATEGDGVHPTIGTSGSVYDALHDNTKVEGLTYFHDEQ